MDIRNRLGRQIADLRDKNKMTQQDLADAADITRVHVNRIEHGKYGMSIDVLDKIATALGVKVVLVDNNDNL